MEKIRICITGGTGFIGSCLVNKLKESDNIEVVLFQGNLLNKKDVEIFFKSNSNIDQVVHLAGSFFGDFDKLFSVNVIATNNLLEQIVKFNIKKIIYISSGAVYGEPIKNISSEKDDLRPNTEYGLTKMYAENLIQFYVRLNNLDYIILRFPNVYGLGNNKGVVYNFLNSIKTKGEITVFGDGKQVRNFLHVSDACQAIQKSLFYRESDIFNISNPIKVSVNDLIKKLNRKYKFKINYEKSNNNLSNLLLSIDKAKEKLKFIPVIKTIKL